MELKRWHLFLVYMKKYLFPYIYAAVGYQWVNWQGTNFKLPPNKQNTLEAN